MKQIYFPKISLEELERRKKKIRIIKRNDELAVAFYIKRTAIEQNLSKALMDFGIEDQDELVNGKQLSYLADIMVYSQDGMECTPNIIFSQIPAEYAIRTIAAEIIFTPNSSLDWEVFDEEIRSNYSPATVRLYQARETSKQKLPQVTVPYGGWTMD